MTAGRPQDFKGPSLPAVSLATPTEFHERTLDPRANDPRVLVAEDDPVMLAMYAEVLREFGYVPMCAVDGGEAMRIFEKERPSLALLDLLMPVIDGFELSRRIRAIASPDDTFILVITGREGPDVLNQVLDAGADDFLGKPVTADQLHARIRIAERTVASRRARRDAEDALARAQWLAGIGETSLALQHEINNPLTSLLGNAALLEGGSTRLKKNASSLRPS